ncbi:MAG: diguanylate cyclase [Myxococcota bacterium]
MRRLFLKAEMEIELHAAYTLKEASHLLTFNDYQCALVDLGLPDGDGMQMLDTYGDLPVIIMTQHEEDMYADVAMRNGAQDYLVKGEFDARQLRRAVRYAVERGRLVSELVRSRTDLKAVNAQLEQMVTHDPLTGLFNRRGLEQRLDQLIKEGQRGRQFAVVMIDIDHFKSINDTYGHAVGDQVIKAVACWLQDNARAVDCVARYGGEEFTLLLVDIEPGEVNEVVERLCSGLAESITEPQVVTASFGVCSFGDSTMDAESLVEAADAALYRAKQQGRNRVCSHVIGPRLKIVG